MQLLRLKSVTPETYFKLCQASMMDSLVKISNGIYSLTQPAFTCSKLKI